MNWDFEPLWSKAKYYFSKAIQAPREGQDFGLFCALALEFTGRATLARIHPVLLADPQDGSNILYAFGYAKPDKSPKSIMAKTVFSRCQTIVDDFGPEDEAFATGFVERRNSELHSGDVAFADFGTDKWLARYYTVIRKLCRHSNTTLLELIGDENEERTAEEMIAAANEVARNEIFARIQPFRQAFEALPRDEQERRVLSQNAIETPDTSERHPCPACAASAVINGRSVRSTPPRLEGDEIVTEQIFLPIELTCTACGLRLETHASLHALGYGGQYAREFAEEASEYYERMYAPQDDDYYGND